MALNKLKFLQYKPNSVYYYEKWYASSPMSRKLEWGWGERVVKGLVYFTERRRRSYETKKHWLSEANYWLRTQNINVTLK